MNLVLLAIALLAGQDAKQWTPAETMKVKSLGDVSPSPDGRRVV